MAKPGPRPQQALLEQSRTVLGWLHDLAVATFDARAFSAPSYYGRGPELAQLLAFFQRQQDNDRRPASTREVNDVHTG